MRIAQITLDGNLPRYGIGLSVLRLSEALARGGDEVLLLCRAGSAAAVPPTPGVRVVPLERRRGLFGGRYAYLRQVRRGLAPGVDVVHVHAATRMASWLLPERHRLGAPLVVTCLAADELGPSASPAGTAPPRRALRHARQAEAVLARAHTVVAPSRWFAGVIAARVVRKNGVEVIPLAPTDRTAPTRRRHTGFVVLALARFVPAKGLATLLDGFAAAFPQDETAHLVLGGDGPEREALLRRASALGITPRVSLPGYLDGEARSLALAGADVVVMPTLGEYETFGLAAAEASAAGVPVIVSSGGALPDRIENGEGIAVPPGDSAALAEALLQVRAEPHRFGAKGAAKAPDWDQIADRHRALYARLAGGASAR